MVGENHLHIVEKGPVQEYFKVPASEKTLSIQTKNFLFEIQTQTQIIQLQMSGNQNISFFQGELHGLKYQILPEDQLISYQYVSVYPYQSKQSLSTEPDKSLSNGSF